MKRNALRLILSLATALCLCLSLCSCSITETGPDELLRPPQLTQSRQQVQHTIEALLGTSYQLIAPAGGDNRSNINLSDLNGDGQNEAICLFTSSGKATLEVLVLAKRGEEWKAIGRYASDATGADRMDFADVTGDGCSEIIIGWSYVTGSERTLQVLEINGKLRSLCKEHYTQFVITEAPSQLILVDLTTTSATLLGWKNGALAPLSSVAMDNRIASLVALTQATAKNSKTAVFIDTVLKDQTYHTEILAVREGKYLENRLFTGETSGIDRPLALRCTDIDGDGQIEVPRCAPMEEGEGASYYTYWSEFDGKELLEPLTTFTGASDRFYFLYPEMWIDRVFVRQDPDVQRQYNFVTKAGEIVYSLRVFTIAEFQQLGEAEGWSPITESTEKIIALRAGDKANEYYMSTTDWIRALHTY